MSPPPPPPLPLFLSVVLLLCLSVPRPPLALAVRHTVSYLPGFHGPLPFHLETGYVGLGDEDEVQLFYYFVPSERDPAEDPLLLWNTGGPGCSSLSALFAEIGPVKFLKVRYDGSTPSLELDPYSWTKFASIIFVESPVGTGFSFSRNPEALKAGDLSCSKQVEIFIRKWLDDHPQFISNPLYVAGDSYAGKIVPIVAHFIAEGNRAGNKPVVNLKGYLVGNPRTGEIVDYFSRVPFLHNMGIISDEIYESTMKHCEGQSYESPSTVECAKNIDVVNEFMSQNNEGFILDPWCPRASPRPKDNGGERRSLQAYSTENILEPPPIPMMCRSYNFYLLYYWANNDLARKALHIQEGTVGEWERCSHNVALRYDTNEIKSSIGYHLDVISKGYRALVYSGDHDAIVPFVGTQAWIASLNLTIVDDWRSWRVDGQVAGYTRSYSNNLTFATVKGAGHIAPRYKAKECLTMIQRWISNNPL